MLRPKRVLPFVVALSGLALVGCADTGEIGLVPAAATTTVGTTTPAGTRPTSSAASSVAPSAASSAASSAAPTTTSAAGEGSTTAPAEPTTSPAEPPRPAPDPVQPVRTEVEIAEAKVFNLTNAERTAHGCPAVGVDERLDRAARGHSEDMAARNYFSHTSKDGRTFAQRIRAAGHPSPGAENIAAGQRTPEAVVKGWMESPGHRANILNCKLKTLGVGMARGGSYGVYWTQNFGW